MAPVLVVREDLPPAACVANDIQNQTRPTGNAKKRDRQRRRNCQCGKHTWLGLVTELLAKWGVMWLHQIFWQVGKLTQNRNH